ncbi:MAG: BspA family leucine-rich repeat surface protein [Bacteroidales bacterium]
MRGGKLNFGRVHMLVYLLVVFTTLDYGAAAQTGDAGEFITTWQMDKDEIFSFPLSYGSYYNFTIEWGDGSEAEHYIGREGNNLNCRHEYSDAGTYTIKIKAHETFLGSGFPKIEISENQRSKLIAIKQWGDIGWQTLENAFAHCVNLDVVAKDVPNLSSVSSLSGMFDGCLEMHGTSAFGSWDVSNVSDMSYMFRNASSFDQNLASWRISLLNDASGMFEGAELSVINYDALLIGWWKQIENGPLKGGVKFHGGSSQYCSGEDARNELINRGWGDGVKLYSNTTDIKDGGKNCTVVDLGDFITKWDVKSVGGKGTIKIPLSDTCDYDFTIDWGDGHTATFSDKGQNIDCSHEYDITGGATEKTFTVKIKANGVDGFPYIYFSSTYGVGNGENRKQLAEITQWGDIRWSTMYQAFANCSRLNVTAGDVPNLSRVTNMQEMFLGCSNLKGTPKFGSWDVSNVENMAAMFSADQHFNQDIGSWDVGNVKNMGFMFFGSRIFDQNLGSWDISSLVSAEMIFFGTTLSTANYDALLISWAQQWKALLFAKPARAGVSFYGGASMYCEGESARAYLVSKGWGYGATIPDGGKDQSMQCSVAEQDYFVTKWRVSAGGTVTIPTVASESYDFTVYWGDDASDVFRGRNITCSHTYKNIKADTFTIKIIGNVDANNDRKYESGFPRILSDYTRESPNRQLLSVEQWGVTLWRSMYKAFYGCVALDVKATDVPNLSLVGSMEGMFTFCHKLVGNESFKDWNVSNVWIMRELFREAELFNIPIGTWNVSRVYDMSEMFRYANVFDQDIGAWNVSRVVAMDSMFLHAHAYTNGGQPLRWTYDDDNNSATAEVSATGTVKSMRAMFEWAFKFNQDISSWDVGSVTDMASMFRSAYAFDQEIGGWNVSKVKSMNKMFYAGDYGEEYKMIFNNGGQPLNWTYDNDNNSATAEVSATGSVADMSGMFYRDTAFNQDIGDWNILSLEYADEMFEHVTLSVSNYDSLLIGWNRQLDASEGKRYVMFSGGNSKYCAGAAARLSLFSMPKEWTISDGGLLAPDNSFYFVDDTLNSCPDSKRELVLSGSEKGVYYQLYEKDSNAKLGDSVDGTGMPLSFFVSPSETASYYVVAQSNSDSTGACASQPLDTALVNVIKDIKGGKLSSSYQIVYPGSNSISLKLSGYAGDIVRWEASANRAFDDYVVINNSGTFYTTSDLDTTTYFRAFIKIDDCDSLYSEIAHVEVSDDAGKFITTWNIGANERFVLPLTYGAAYGFIIDWGDGTAPEAYDGVAQDLDCKHDYIEAGIYTIKIKGTLSGRLPKITIIDEQVRDKLLSVAQWGDGRWSSMEEAFSDCKNMDVTAKDIPNFSELTDLSSMFRGCTSLRGTATFSEWDVSTVKKMNNMFQGASVFDQNIGTWDVSSLEEAGYMLAEARLSVANYDSLLIGWNRQVVASTAKTGVPFHGGNSKYCKGETARNSLINNSWGEGGTIPDKGLDCTEQELNSFITRWSLAAYGEVMIPTIISENYDFTVDWGDGSEPQLFNSSPVIAIHSYTNPIPEVFTVKIRANQDNDGDGKNETGFPRMSFEGIPYKDKIIDVVQWGSIKWQSMEEMFKGCVNLDVSAEDAPNLTDVSSMSSVFEDCSSLVGTSAFNTWNVEGVEDMSRLFKGAKYFNQELNTWIVSNVLDMRHMFRDAEAFNQDLSKWAVGRVEDMRYMFAGAKKFNKNIGDWLVGNVDSMHNMFDGALSFNQDIGGWDVGKVATMNRMFRGARSFDQDLSGWNIPELVDADGMFNSVRLSISNYDALLISWDRQLANNRAKEKVKFDGGLSIYCTGEEARSRLINRAWGDGLTAVDGYPDSPNDIKDGGKASPSIPDDFNGEFYLCAGDTVSLPLEGASDPLVDYQLYDAASNLPVGDSIKGTGATIYFKVSPEIAETKYYVKACYHTDVSVSCTSVSSGITTVYVHDKKSEISPMHSRVFEATNSTDITVSAYTGTLKAWQYSEDPTFTTYQEVLDPSGNTFTLSNVSANTYVRAFFSSVVCGGYYSDTAFVEVVSASDLFITEWQVQDGDIISIPLVDDANYNFTVDWGDGSGLEVYEGANITSSHTYTTGGTYSIKIAANIDVDKNGTYETGFPRIHFKHLDSKDKIYAIKQWGSIRWTSMFEAFESCLNLDVKAGDIPDLSTVRSLGRMFAQCESLVGTAKIGDWDVSTITEMNHMFYFNYLFNQNIGAWDVHNVVRMNHMFTGAYSFDNGGQPLRWTHDHDNNPATPEVSATGKVENMEAMFMGANSFNRNINHWDVSKVTIMKSMFKEADAFNQDIGAWNVVSVSDMSYMFDHVGAYNNAGQPLSWTYDHDNDAGTPEVSSTGTVTYALYMFRDAEKFNQDISDWDVSSVAKMNEMFKNARSFDQDLSDWDISSLNNASSMFEGIKLSLANYDSLLIGWNRQLVAGKGNKNVAFHGGNSQYCAGAEARASMLSDTYAWKITDAGSAAALDDIAFVSDTIELCVGVDTLLQLDSSELGYKYELFAKSDDTQALASVAGTGDTVGFRVSPSDTLDYYVLAIRATETGSDCDTVRLSKELRVNVAPVSVGGSVMPSQSVVYTQFNKVVLSLANHVGGVQQWESSINADFSDSVVVRTNSPVFTATNITDSTYYRALVKSGACDSVYSDTAVIYPMLNTCLSKLTDSADIGKYFDALYTFDGSGFGQDMSGNAYHLADNNKGLSFERDDAILGSALRFGGMSVLYNDDTTFMSAPLSNFSVGFWMKPDNSALADMQILFEEGDSNNGISIVLEGGQLKVCIAYTAGGQQKNELVAPYPQDGGWHHLMLQLDDKGIILLYIDGGISAYFKAPLVWEHGVSGVLGHEHSSAFGNSSGDIALTGNVNYNGYKGLMDDIFYTRKYVSGGKNFLYNQCASPNPLLSMDCEHEVVQSNTLPISEGGGIRWSRINLITGDLMSVNDETHDMAKALGINSIGYNSLDGLLYGVSQYFLKAVGAGTEQAFRTVSGLDADGKFITRYVVLNDFKTVVGDVFGGYQYLSDKKTDKDDVFRYNVDNSSPDYLSESGVKLGTIPHQAELGYADWAVSPIDTCIYTLSNIASSDDDGVSTIYKFDLESGVGSVFGETQFKSVSTGTFGAIYFDGDGFMYGLENFSGTNWRVKVHNDFDRAAKVSASEVSNMNDGARCPFAPSPVDFADAPQAFVSANGVGYTTSLDDDGARHYVSLYDTANHRAKLMLGSLVDIDLDGVNDNREALGDDLTECRRDNNNADDEDALAKFPEMSMVIADYSLNVGITNTTGKDAYLMGWIDFNADGVFDATELAYDTVASGLIAASGDSVELTWDAQSLQNKKYIYLQSDSTYMRLRITSDLTVYKKQKSLSVGMARDGEVEDYLVTTNCSPHRVPDMIMELCLADNDFDINIVEYIPYGDLDSVAVWDASGREIDNPQAFPASSLNKNAITVFSYYYEKKGFCVGSKPGKIYINGLADNRYANFKHRTFSVCGPYLKEGGYKLNPIIPYITKSGEWLVSSPAVAGTSVDASPYFIDKGADGMVFDGRGFWAAVIAANNGEAPDKVSVSVHYSTGREDVCAGADKIVCLTLEIFN